MGRSLIATVFVRGQAYGPGSDVPDDVAAQITNPDVWAPEATQKAQEAPRTAPSAPEAPNGGARGAERAQTGDSPGPRSEAKGAKARGSKPDPVDRLSKS